MHADLAHGSSRGRHVMLGDLKDSLARISVSKSPSGGFKLCGRAAAFYLRRSPTRRLCIKAAAARQRHFGLPTVARGSVLGALMA
jgi:hypothetical protein